MPLRCGVGRSPHRLLECPACGWRFYADPDERVAVIRAQVRAIEQLSDKQGPQDDPPDVIRLP